MSFLSPNEAFARMNIIEKLLQEGDSKPTCEKLNYKTGSI